MSKAIVYLLTRSGAVLLVASEVQKAHDMLDAHVKFRTTRESCILQRDLHYEPAPVPAGRQVRIGGSEGHPVLQDADPVICCALRETELIDQYGYRTIYRIVQHCVQ